MEMVSAPAVAKCTKAHQAEIELRSQVSDWPTATGSQIDCVDPSVSLFEMERIFDGPETHPGVIRPLASDSCNYDIGIDQSCGSDRESERGMEILIKATLGSTSQRNIFVEAFCR